MEIRIRTRGRRTGIHAAVAIHDTINTVVGTSPRNGLINDASCCVTLVCLFAISPLLFQSA
jgi:hypothetical protein